MKKGIFEWSVDERNERMKDNGNWMRVIKMDEGKMSERKDMKVVERYEEIMVNKIRRIWNGGKNEVKLRDIWREMDLIDSCYEI